MWIVTASQRVSIPNGLFKSFRLQTLYPGIFRWIVFQSQTGFSSHSDNSSTYTSRYGVSFQSQTGFSSHSDASPVSVTQRACWSFNPKRAFQVIPTLLRHGALSQPFPGFNPKRAFQVIPTQDFNSAAERIVLVSIPNGLFKSFRHRALVCMPLGGNMVSIPNGLFKSFRQM